ncbi:MAG TPA: hypothetical protein VGL91_10275 [Acidobacteriota bacterium]|jgi:CheY-like chemotaxis protein
MILALVDDLFFSSKITETAKQLECALKVVTTREALLTEIDSHPESLIFDLNCRSCEVVELIGEIRRRGIGVPMMAFVSHVQTDLARSAREAGCDKVVPRSYFSAHLPEILSTR